MVSNRTDCALERCVLTMLLRTLLSTAVGIVHLKPGPVTVGPPAWSPAGHAVGWLPKTHCVSPERALIVSLQQHDHQTCLGRLVLLDVIL